jgi:hypothetical protein
MYLKLFYTEYSKTNVNKFVLLPWKKFWQHPWTEVCSNEAKYYFEHDRFLNLLEVSS